MSINLCYVKGINEVDTPYFISERSQQSFFDSHLVWSDDTSYYPPYFRNIIRLSASDIPFNDTSKRANYLWLLYDGKRYYYFIDSIDYVTDDLYEIHISMDTIQTYMFDLKVTKPFVSRKAIKRWGEDKTEINRDYIRENLSDNVMRKKRKNPIFTTSSNRVQWLVIKATEDFLYEKFTANTSLTAEVRESTSGHITYDGASDYGTYGGCYYLIPYGNWVYESGESIYVSFAGVSGDPKPLKDMYSLIRSLASDDRVTSMQLIPYNILSTFVSLTSSTYNGKRVLRVDYKMVQCNGTDSESQPIVNSYKWYYLSTASLSSSSEAGALRLVFPDISQSTANNSFLEPYPNVMLTIQGTLNVMRTSADKTIAVNSETGIAYDSSYVPAMYDESYMQARLGDNSGYTMAPLFYMKTTTLKALITSTLDGNMVYAWSFDSAVLGIYGDAIIDMCNTLLISQSSISLDLYTSPWKNYQVSHKGSVITDWIATASSAAAKGTGALAMAHLTQPSQPKPYEAQYQGLSVAQYGGYKTGFAMYREIYKGRQRDIATGRFVSGAYTYTGGNY